jgi:hypothetical protein
VCPARAGVVRAGRVAAGASTLRATGRMRPSPGHLGPHLVRAAGRCRGQDRPGPRLWQRPLHAPAARTRRLGRGRRDRQRRGTLAFARHRAAAAGLEVTYVARTATDPPAAGLGRGGHSAPARGTGPTTLRFLMRCTSSVRCEAGRAVRLPSFPAGSGCHSGAASWLGRGWRECRRRSRRGRN